MQRRLTGFGNMVIIGVHSNINKGREEGSKREVEVTMKWRKPDCTGLVSKW